VNKCKGAKDCTIPMGVTSDNVAKQFNILREEQDNFALNSHQKACIAMKNQSFDEEICPIGTITSDDGVRENTSLAALSKLKCAFSRDGTGTTTAGNSSQVSDGAAAVMVTRASYAREAKIPILALFTSYAVIGCPPSIMGIGPALAIPEALRRAGLQIADIDVFEINEAFSSQILFTIKYLGLPTEKVNPYGGAIALGHPLGCTGARLTVTLIHYLRRTGQRYGIVAMCIGTGMGAAAVIENPDYDRSRYKSCESSSNEDKSGDSKSTSSSGGSSVASFGRVSKL